MIRYALSSLTALPLALFCGTQATAQDLADRPVPPPAIAETPSTASDDEVAFSANALDYDNDADVVTATGDVRMTRAGNRLRADKVVYDRKSGQVLASGSVAVVNPQGDIAYGDSIELTDSLKDGIVENLLLVLEDGGRLAADHGVRANGVTTLTRAAYTPCRVSDDTDCPKKPTWKITAVRVIHDPVRHRISYEDARLHLFGATVLWLPRLSHPDGSDSGGGSGLLVPDFRYSNTNGAQITLPYYWKLAPNRDLLISPRIYTKVLPLIEAKYRALTANGAYQIGGLLTYSSRVPAGLTPGVGAENRELRGYLDANGRFQFGPDWTIVGSTRATSDRTFLRRYDLSSEDRLRTMLSADRVTEDSYLSIAGWAVQTLRANDSQGQQAIALPAVDYRRRIDDPLLGGKIELQLNSLSILRTKGQDTQRAFAGVRWDLRRLTPLGQEVTFTAYGRADAYHTDEITETATAVYRGRDGWTGRGIAAVAADMRWPFLGNFAGGAQQIAPRVQIVASPRTRNLSIPNEDARAIDLEDSNLFALNRFAGYDRWEDGTRLTYGLEWAYDRPRLSVRAIVGQSYRLTDRGSILPDGTGLSDRLSDIVGRTTIKYGRFIELTHRYRIDKESFAVRRNDVDATIGSSSTYVTVGYLRLNRNIDTSIEDLRDREELRAGARVQFARHWSVFGSAVIDLTNRREDPTNLGDGFEPVRQRIGVTYEDECIEMGITLRRDYDSLGDARGGNTVLLRLALKNLGR